MKILHTSDWHLGNTWNGRSRKKEFQVFLDWMLETLKTERPDALIVAGDIFDTSTPSPGSQAMYFEFLRDASSFCRNIIIISGNHDSPSLLDAPKPLLDAMNVHVVGTATGQDKNPEDDLVVLKSETGEPELIVATVPFLRSQDIRRIDQGETTEDKERKYIDGIRQHYARLCEFAETIRSGRNIPLIATGHLFVAGGKTSEGVREIHVGTLGQLGGDLFPNEIDYLALGHLHIPQRIGGSETRRYSGSPLPMSFAEAEQEKMLLRIAFFGRQATVDTISVPEISHLVRIRGDLEQIKKKLKELAKESRETFVEIEYSGNEILPDLAQKIEKLSKELPENIVVLRIKNDRLIEGVQLNAEPTEELEQLEPTDVFQRLLDKTDQQAMEKGLEELPQLELMSAFKEILSHIQETS